MKFSENVRKLRRGDRITALEVERVVRLCLRDDCGQRFLDIGTGSGVFAEAFVNRGLQVFGIDPDPEMIEAASRYVPGVAFVVAAGEQLPFGDHFFDIAFMGMVLHETADPGRVMAEAQRVTCGLAAILEWPFPGPDDPTPAARRFQTEEVCQLSEAAGFGVTAIHRLSNMILYLNRA